MKCIVFNFWRKKKVKHFLCLKEEVVNELIALDCIVVFAKKKFILTITQAYA